MTALIRSILPDTPQDLVFVYPDVSIKQCADIMVQNHIGAVLVMDDDKLVGIVSERDITRNCVHQGLDPEQACAMDIAYANVVRLSAHDSISNASQAMSDTKRRHILIDDDDGVVMAILSIGDIVAHQLSNCSHTIEHLEQYINS